MALVSRLTRLFQADFHAVLDRIEEPDLQLRQAVREMQFALEQDRQRFKLVAHEIERIKQLLSDTTDQRLALNEELDICLEANKEDLARDLVRRKLIAENQLKLLQQQLLGFELQQQQLEKQLQEQTQQLDSMQQKLELLVSDDLLQDPENSAQVVSIRNEEIEIALLREKQRRAKS